MGSEMLDCCAACAAEIRASRNAPEARTGCCDWCKQMATDLRDRRDIDEGMSGRVYRVCGKCAADDNDALSAELEDWYDRYGDPGDFYHEEGER